MFGAEELRIECSCVGALVYLPWAKRSKMARCKRTRLPILRHGSCFVAINFSNVRMLMLREAALSRFEYSSLLSFIRNSLQTVASQRGNDNFRKTKNYRGLDLRFLAHSICNAFGSICSGVPAAEWAASKTKAISVHFNVFVISRMSLSTDK